MKKGKPLAAQRYEEKVKNGAEPESSERLSWLLWKACGRWTATGELQRNDYQRKAKLARAFNVQEDRVQDVLDGEAAAFIKLQLLEALEQKPKLSELAKFCKYCNRKLLLCDCSPRLRALLGL